LFAPSPSVATRANLVHFFLIGHVQRVRALFLYLPHTLRPKVSVWGGGGAPPLLPTMTTDYKPSPTPPLTLRLCCGGGGVCGLLCDFLILEPKNGGPPPGGAWGCSVFYFCRSRPGWFYAPRAPPKGKSTASYWGGGGGASPAAPTLFDFCQGAFPYTGGPKCLVVFYSGNGPSIAPFTPPKNTTRSNHPHHFVLLCSFLSFLGSLFFFPPKTTSRPRLWQKETPPHHLQQGGVFPCSYLDNFLSLAPTPPREVILFTPHIPKNTSSCRTNE